VHGARACCVHGGVARRPAGRARAPGACLLELLECDVHEPAVVVVEEQVARRDDGRRLVHLRAGIAGARHVHMATLTTCLAACLAACLATCLATSRQRRGASLERGHLASMGCPVGLPRGHTRGHTPWACLATEQGGCGA
jgi:hypothetical protein